MRSSFTRLAGSTRRRVVLVGAGALTVVALGAGTTAAFAASSAAPSASASASTSAQYPSLHALLRQLPGSLKADLKTLHGDKGSAKTAERTTIEGKALAGTYGPEVARIAHLFAGKDGAKTKATSLIPAALKADLKTLHGDARGSSTRASELSTIWGKALGGSYGTEVQTAAKAAVAQYQAHHKG